MANIVRTYNEILKDYGYSVILDDDQDDLTISTAANEIQEYDEFKDYVQYLHRMHTDHPDYPQRVQALFHDRDGFRIVKYDIGEKTDSLVDHMKDIILLMCEFKDPHTGRFDTGHISRLEYDDDEYEYFISKFRIEKKKNRFTFFTEDEFEEEKEE